MSEPARSADEDSYANVPVAAAAKAPVDPTPEARVAAREREPHPSPDMRPDSMRNGVSSPAFLTGLVKWHPAVGSFQYLADCVYSADTPPHQRFTKLGERWPWLMWGCIALDFVYLIVVLLGLATISGLIVYKTIWD